MAGTRPDTSRPDTSQAPARLPPRDRRALIGDRRFDLQPVADDRGVREQQLDVRRPEACNDLRIEVRERLPKRVALAENRQPGEARLEALETELLEQAALVKHRPAPLAIVV